MKRIDPVPSTERLQITVPPETQATVRADRLVKQHLPFLSRRTIENWFALKAVRIQGRPISKGYQAAAGQVLEIQLPAPLAEVPLPDPEVPLSIVYEDPELLILAKPGLLPTHPLDPFEKGTLVNALRAVFPRIQGVGDRLLEPGLVHRLDRGTSGLLAVTLTQTSWNQAKKDLAARKWEKTYKALVRGRVETPLFIDLPLAHDPKDEGKMKVVSPEDRKIRGRPYPALTRIRPLKVFPDHTLVEIDLVTGVTHQIRVHLAWAGHPLVGDERYGGPPAPLYGLPEGRFFLHAARLSLPHPKTGQKMSFALPLPEDLKGVVFRVHTETMSKSSRGMKNRRRFPSPRRAHTM